MCRIRASGSFTINRFIPLGVKVFDVVPVVAIVVVDDDVVDDDVDCIFF